MKLVLISAAALLAMQTAPVHARTVPTFHLSVGAAAVAFSTGTVLAPLETGTRVNAAAHQGAFAATENRFWNADAAFGGNGHAATGRQDGVKSPRVPEPSTTAMLSAGCGVLLLARRRRPDNAVR